jgi:hypothetical protein
MVMTERSWKQFAVFPHLKHFFFSQAKRMQQKLLTRKFGEQLNREIKNYARWQLRFRFNQQIFALITDKGERSAQSFDELKSVGTRTLQVN